MMSHFHHYDVLILGTLALVWYHLADNVVENTLAGQGLIKNMIFHLKSITIGRVPEM